MATVKVHAQRWMHRRLIVALLGIIIGTGEITTEPACGAEEPDPVATIDVDVAIYSATPAGIAAAVASGRQGRRVLLIEPTRHVGGLVTNGLSHADFRTFEGLTGTYYEFTRRVRSYYDEKYGPDSPQAQECFRGTSAEPHVNEAVFARMLSEVPTVRVQKRLRLTDVQTEPQGNGSRKITSARFTGADGTQLTARAAIYIDASYEGDLMALAGVPYRVGREAESEYGESLAPEVADKQVQGYNFRLIVTREPANRILPTAPDGYRREDFLPLLPLLGTDRLKSVFVPSTGGVYKAHLPPLPNGKHDVNDVSRGLVRLSLPNLSDAWPEADAATRRRIFAEHVRHNVGMLYFLQNDEAVSKAFREEARQWGWCRDEFTDNQHLPEQLYIREARRMVGQYIFTEGDTAPAEKDTRSVLRRDAIAMGDYGPNCHGTAHEGPRIGGHHTGEFYKRVAPYQIPYGVLLPKNCENLLVPVACSASHVGFCALRLEPIWTSLGQAAGLAADVAIEKQIPVQTVPVDAVQSLLHTSGAATIYISDVPPESDDFPAVQWWGTQGGLHGLEPNPETPGQRGEHITSQYYEAFPGHAAKLNQPLTAEIHQRWLKLIRTLGLPGKDLQDPQTRGDFIRRAHALHQASGASRSNR